MKKVLSYLLLSALNLFFYSCIGNSDVLSLDVKEVDYLNKSQITIDGEKLDWNIEGSIEMAIRDSLLMFVGEDVDGFLKVFSLNSFNQIGKFCLKGRAKNEFIQAVSLTEQTYVNKGNIIYPLVNIPAFELKEINVTESLRKQSTVVSSVTECSSKGEFILLDDDVNKRFESRLFQNSIEMKRRDIPVSYFLCDGKKEKTVRVFNRIMKIEDETDIYVPYVAQMSKHPDRNLIVEVHSGIDYIFYFDIDKKEHFAIHQAGTITYNDYLEYQKVGPLVFSDVAVASDYFFVLYWNGEYSKSFDKSERKPELILFDWEGNFINSVKLNQQIHSIEYDERNKVLYGINRIDETLYRFDVKHLIP